MSTHFLKDKNYEEFYVFIVYTVNLFKIPL
jgi:hypothetical protein